MSTTTIEVPGGEATLYSSMDDMSPRRRRPIEIVSARLGRKLAVIQQATRLLIDGEVITDQSDARNDDGSAKPGGDVEITEKDLELLLRLGDVSAFALLKSWTLPIPVPTTEAEFVDNTPTPVYDVISREAARIVATAASAVDGFSIDAVEDATSPTGG